MRFFLFFFKIKQERVVLTRFNALKRAAASIIITKNISVRHFGVLPQTCVVLLTMTPLTAVRQIGNVRCVKRQY